VSYLQIIPILSVQWKKPLRLVHTTDKTWYTVLYHHTMYVISLSNISLKTNFKQISTVELKCIQYSEGDYSLCVFSSFWIRTMALSEYSFWIRIVYLILYTFSFEINQSRLSDIRCLIPDVVSPDCGDKRSRYFFRSFNNVRLLCFVSHSNGMT
jgi:hypothetical protein